MARFGGDVFRNRTTSMVERLLALLGIEDGRWPIRQAYAFAPIRRPSVSRTNRLTCSSCREHRGTQGESRPGCGAWSAGGTFMNGTRGGTA